MVAFVKKYFLPYMNVVKFCSPETHADCFVNEYHGLTGVAMQFKPRPTAVLADGLSISFNLNPSARRYVSIGFDVNGFKKPNVASRDIFSLNLYKDIDRIILTGFINGYTDGKYTYDDMELLRQKCENKTVTGWECSALVVTDGFKINY